MAETVSACDNEWFWKQVVSQCGIVKTQHAEVNAPIDYKITIVQLSQCGVVWQKQFVHVTMKSCWTAIVCSVNSHAFDSCKLHSWSIPS